MLRKLLVAVTVAFTVFTLSAFSLPQQTQEVAFSTSIHQAHHTKSILCYIIRRCW